MRDTPECEPGSMSVMSNESVRCMACGDDLEHCHGIAIIRIDESHDCSEDPDCHLDADLHLFITWEDADV